MATRKKEVAISEHDVLMAQIKALGLNNEAVFKSRADLHDAVFDYIVSFCKTNKKPPTVRQISAHIDASESTTKRVLTEMTKLGRLIRHPVTEDGKSIYIPVVV